MNDIQFNSIQFTDYWMKVYFISTFCHNTRKMWIGRYSHHMFIEFPPYTTPCFFTVYLRIFCSRVVKQEVTCILFYYIPSQGKQINKLNSKEQCEEVLEDVQCNTTDQTFPIFIKRKETPYSITLLYTLTVL